MPDLRTRREKLRAMAGQSASPFEAEVARRLLERLEGHRARIETPRVLGRDDILTRPDRRTYPRANVSYTNSNGTRIHLDLEDIDVTFRGLGIAMKDLDKAVRAAMTSMKDFHDVFVEVEEVRFSEGEDPLA